MSYFSSALALFFTIALYVIFLLMLLFSCGYSFYFYAKNIIIDTITVIRIVHIVNINGFCYIFLFFSHVFQQRYTLQIIQLSQIIVLFLLIWLKIFREMFINYLKNILPHFFLFNLDMLASIKLYFAFY